MMGICLPKHDYVEWPAGRQAPPDTTPPTDEFAARSAPPVPLCASPEMSLPIPLINQHHRMFLKSWSGLRREHRQLVFRIGQGGDDRRLGEMEGAEAQPIPAVGLRSFGLGDREDRSRPAFANLAALRWPMFGIMPALLWPSVRPPWGLPDCDSDNRFQYHYMWCRKKNSD